MSGGLFLKGTFLSCPQGAYLKTKQVVLDEEKQQPKRVFTRWQAGTCPLQWTFIAHETFMKDYQPLKSH